MGKYKVKVLIDLQSLQGLLPPSAMILNMPVASFYGLSFSPPLSFLASDLFSTFLVPISSNILHIGIRRVF